MDNWNTPGADYQQPPVVNVNNPSDKDKVVVTMKAGTGFDAPWVVFHAASNAEAADLIGAAQATGLFALVAEGSKALQGHFNVGNVLGGRPVQAPAAAESGWNAGPPQQQAQAPQQAPQGTPPGQQAPTCPHGTKKWVEGNNKNTGKSYKFWGCPARQGDPTQCPPQWVN